MIESDAHLGRQGKHIKYHGRSLPKHEYGYICEINDKQTHFVNGTKLEEAVKGRIRRLFATSQDKFWQRLNQINGVNRPQLEVELKAQTVKLSKVLQQQAKLEERKMDTERPLGQGAYDLLYTKFHALQASIEAGIKETQSQIASADNAKEMAASFDGIKERFMDVLNDRLLDSDGNVTDIMFSDHPEYNTRWRQLLEALDLKIHLDCQFTIETEEQAAERHKGEIPLRITDGEPEWDERKITHWDESDDNTFFDVLNFPPYDTMAYMTLRGGLLLQSEKLASIASGEPPNNTLRISLSDLLNNSTFIESIACLPPSTL